MAASQLLCVLIQAFAALEATKAQQTKELAVAQKQIKQLGQEAVASGATTSNLQKQQQVPHLHSSPTTNTMLDHDSSSPSCAAAVCIFQRELPAVMVSTCILAIESNTSVLPGELLLAHDLSSGTRQ